MRKHLRLALSLVLVAGFAISCASKKKTENLGGTEGGAMDANIGSQDMSFDASGSDSGKINGLKTVRFDYDSATLSSESRNQLNENAQWIKANGKTTVQIEGHCDNRGSVEYNLALGERRAKSVKNYLIGLGVDSKRLTIISYGEEKPLAQGDSEDAYAKNRRANFVPLGM